MHVSATMCIGQGIDIKKTTASKIYIIKILQTVTCRFGKWKTKNICRSLQETCTIRVGGMFLFSVKPRYISRLPSDMKAVDPRANWRIWEHSWFTTEPPVIGISCIKVHQYVLEKCSRTLEKLTSIYTYIFNYTYEHEKLLYLQSPTLADWVRVHRQSLKDA